MSSDQKLRSGTRIELHGTPAFPGFPGVDPQIATNGPIPTHLSPTNGGWHVIKFADGGKLLAHETRFRVIDNR